MNSVGPRKIPGLYSFVKLLCRTLFHIFFREYGAFHTESIPQQEPLLVVSNHGNYLLDGLALLATHPGQISFLMAQPNFKTAIGGIARKIGAIPVLRPQDATKYDGAGLVTIAHDGCSISGDGIGTQLSQGDTVYIECGSFQDATKDDRVTQCYAVVEDVINERQVTFKQPGLKWLPATLTSERDITYIKSHKIVDSGSLKIRVECGNTMIGINNALKAHEQQQNAVFMANSATGTIGKFVQKIFSKSPEAEASAAERQSILAAHAMENGTFTSGADIPGSVTAPPNIFQNTESTPLLRNKRSLNSPIRAMYTAASRNSSNLRLSSFSTNHSTRDVNGGYMDADEQVGMGVQLEEEDLLNQGNTSFAYMITGNKDSNSATIAPPTSARHDVASSPAMLTPPTTSMRFPTVPCMFQYARPIDHSMIYESVWKNFEDNRTVAVFPEGVSSDDYHLLDFKYGCTIMVLGYLARQQQRQEEQHSTAASTPKTLRIIPCGLNFFNRHRFRSRFYADYGHPITVPDHLIEMYREGGEAKKKACTELLQMIHDAVEGLTLNAPNYDELRLIKATRRLYSSTLKKPLTMPQKLELTRRFAKGYSKLVLTPKVAEIKRDINAYDKHLTNKGVQDWQLTADPNLIVALVCTLPALFCLPALFLLSLPGTLLFEPVGLIATSAANYKGRQAMLAFQSYLPVSRWPGRDVIATWKIVASLALMPICFILYATLLTIWVGHWAALHDYYWSMSRLMVFWILATFVLFPTIAYCTVWIWEWQIDLKMQIQVWWSKLCGGNAEMKRWRRDLVGKVNELVERMGGHDAFDISGHC
ncbi:hypothetical protein BX616_004377 [Lobosporangium transversale]|nr:hypothetical protein BX616_004377 [Lobosporangium transversale]